MFFPQSFSHQVVLLVLLFVLVLVALVVASIQSLLLSHCIVVILCVCCCSCSCCCHCYCSRWCAVVVFFVIIRRLSFVVIRLSPSSPSCCYHGVLLFRVVSRCCSCSCPCGCCVHSIVTFSDKRRCALI